MFVVHIPTRSYLIATVVVSTVLFIAGLGFDLVFLDKPGHPTRKFFSTLSEAALPVWFASTQLAFASFLALFIGLDGYRKSRKLNLWFAAASVLMLMSLDDAAKLHETVNRQLTEIGDLDQSVFRWVLYTLPVAVVTTAVMFKWFLALPGSVRFIFGVGATMFVIGAIGLEILASELVRTLEAESLQSDARNVILASIEELLEMIGVGLVVMAFAKYVNEFAGEVRTSNAYSLASLSTQVSDSNQAPKKS